MLRIEITKKGSIVQIETEKSKLSLEAFEAYHQYKLLADNKDCIIKDDYGEFMVFNFLGIRIAFIGIYNGANVYFNYNKESLAVGVFDKTKFRVKLLVGKRHKEMEKLMTAIEITGIYLSNPNMKDKLSHYYYPDVDFNEL